MKILMVCLGNICRSPMAEGILRDKAFAAGYSIETDSAGTGNYHIGEKPDHRAIACMKKHGHDITGLRARQFQQTDFDAFDIIFAMDRSNHSTILKLARHDADRSKVHLMLGELNNSSVLEVPDPYFGGHEGFEEVYQLLDTACDRLLDRLS